MLHIEMYIFYKYTHCVMELKADIQSMKKNDGRNVI